MGGETKTTMVKVKPSSQDGPSKVKLDSSLAKKKNPESSIKRPLDFRSKFTSTVTKTEVKASSRSSKITKKTTTEKTREKKVYSLPGQKYDVPEEREPLRIFYESLSKQIPSSEMAEFWLIVVSQRKLLDKNVIPIEKIPEEPISGIITIMSHYGGVLLPNNSVHASHFTWWMMEHGLLSPERAKKAYERKQMKQKQLRMGTPVKSPPPPLSRNKPESSNKQKEVSNNGEVKAKKRIIDDSDDDDDFILSHKRRKG